MALHMLESFGGNIGVLAGDEGVLLGGRRVAPTA